ncbi:MAG: WbqC family protein [Bacteroidetes bacterium]|nr:WbqC family protein [Bacteroidota bacterium]
MFRRLSVKDWGILKRDEMENKILIEPHYLPSLEYLCTIFSFDEIILEGNEHFEKQSYRNRGFINGANGKLMLTVPLTERKGKIFTKDVRIEPGKKWRNNHWRAIESAYRKAPFYEHYADELASIIYSNHNYLIELNYNLLSFCLKHIGLQKKISETLAYHKIVSEDILDGRSVISSKKPFTDRSFYQPAQYYQVFGNEFAANLSFVDLLFCEGPRAKEVIVASSLLLNK